MERLRTGLIEALADIRIGKRHEIDYRFAAHPDVLALLHNVGPPRIRRNRILLDGLHCKYLLIFSPVEFLDKAAVLEFLDDAVVDEIFRLCISELWIVFRQKIDGQFNRARLDVRDFIGLV